MISRETKKELALLSIIVATVAVIAITVPMVLRRTNDTVHGPKYAMLAGERLVDYMRRNNGSWPSDWDELKSDRGSSPEDHELLDAMRRMVVIDFDFEPTKPDPQGIAGPVSLSSGAELNDDFYPDPNVIISKYLESRAASQAEDH
ncbi:MAG: hypothetical protein AAF394_12775 [Planctomycetota bacterium]